MHGRLVCWRGDSPPISPSTEENEEELAGNLENFLTRGHGKRGNSRPRDEVPELRTRALLTDPVILETGGLIEGGALDRAGDGLVHDGLHLD